MPVTTRTVVRRPRQVRRRGDAVAIGVVIGAFVGAVASLAPALSAGGTAAPALVLLLGTFAGVCLGGGIGLLVDRRRPVRTPQHLADPPPAPPDPRLRELGPPGLVGPGWYDDPLGGDARRYWDGEAWTEHTWRASGGRGRSQVRKAPAARQRR